MINETGVFFFPGGGHDHDGENSSLIDTNFYSVFDFQFTTDLGGPDRRRTLDRNFHNFTNFVIDVVNKSIIQPAGIRFQPGSINGSSDIITNSITTNSIQAGAITANLIQAGTITANLISSNTITANNIATGTITANLLSSNVVLVNQVIKSNNYVTGQSGWSINGNGSAEFGSVEMRGTIDATAGNIAGFEIGFQDSPDSLHTGGNFLGTMDLGKLFYTGQNLGPVHSNFLGDDEDKAGVRIDGPSGVFSELLYDLLLLDNGSGDYVALTYGEIEATGNIAAGGDIAALGEVTGAGGVNAGGTGVYYNTPNLPGSRFGMAFGWDADAADITFIVNNDTNVDGFITPDGFYSDRRLKHNIFQLNSEVLEKIYSIKIYEFDYKDDIPYESLRGKHGFGVIADEMDQLFPELVVNKDDLEKYKQVVYVKTIPLLLGAIGDLNSRLIAVEQLNSEINELKSKVSELESYLFNGPNNEV